MIVETLKLIIFLSLVIGPSQIVNARQNEILDFKIPVFIENIDHSQISSNENESDNIEKSIPKLAKKITEVSGHSLRVILKKMEPLKKLVCKEIGKGSFTVLLSFDAGVGSWAVRMGTTGGVRVQYSCEN